MKNIWLWLIGGAVGVFLLFKWKSNQTAATTSAAAGIHENPVNTFWDFSNSQSAAASLANVSAAQKNALSLWGTIRSAFGTGARGANSPQTAGSGSGGPTQAQVDAATNLGNLGAAVASFGSTASGNFGG